jgi:hypothetical protein
MIESIEWKNHPDLVSAITYLDEVENAIIEYSNFKISNEEYVQRVTPFDKHLYTCYYNGKQKTNPFNTNQNKSFSNWKELYWMPMVERLRKRLVEATGIPFVLIQGEKNRVAVSVYENGKWKSKDVDLGMGLISTSGFVIPIIAIECKGGHACATCHDGIWGQGTRMKKTFPNSLQGFITDNHKKERPLLSNVLYFPLLPYLTAKCRDLLVLNLIYELISSYESRTPTGNPTILNAGISFISLL